MSSVFFTAEDIRQYYYCNKRIIYYRYVLNVRTRETYKMRKGREVHEKASISVNDVEVRYGFYIRSEKLGLVGIIDALIIHGDRVDIVEFKRGSMGREMRDSHKAQLAAQAMLVEEELGLRVNKIRVYDPDTGESREVRLVNYHREIVREALEEMRRIVLEEDFPEPPIDKGKCIDCEFRIFCSDFSLSE